MPTSMAPRDLTPGIAPGSRWWLGRKQGVGLPHSSSAQFGSGAHVPASALQPGDLVFYYSPISHVGMYIGNGLIVHAAHPGAGVRVAGLYSMPFSGAVRPG
ncbi:MAG: NlpC/P60 family protein [Nocardioides sp.]